jgi:phosphate transport system permease protein
MNKPIDGPISDIERARSRLLSSRLIGRSKRADRIAKYVITAGGAVTIFAVCAVLVLIVAVALPLFLPPSSRKIASLPDSAVGLSGPFVAAGIDEHLDAAYCVNENGDIQFLDLLGGTRGKSIPYPRSESQTTNTHVIFAEPLSPESVALTWSDGVASVLEVKTERQVDAEGKQQLEGSVEEKARIAAPEGEVPLRSLVRISDEGRVVRVDFISGNRLRLFVEATSENLLGESTKESKVSSIEVPNLGSIVSIALSHDGSVLYGGTNSGHLLRWELDGSDGIKLDESILAATDGSAITALGYVFGDVSIAVGDEKGRLTTWFQTPSEDESGAKQLRMIHVLEPHNSAVRTILGCLRNKSIASLDDAGTIHIDHMTSERHLFELQSAKPAKVMHYAARGNGLLAVDETGGIDAWQLDAPHPEAGLRTLFGKVWYERYSAPEYVWQSSASNDDNEPKLSVVPLVFGSIKGTLYAMLFAVPIALLSAMYTSQFASPRLRGYIKPAIEIMAAIPSVVIGFLAALWLAPLVEDHIIAFFLFLIALPCVFIPIVVVRQAIAKSKLVKSLERGYEFLAVVPFIVFAALLAYWSAGPVEAALFGGDFKTWFFREVGGRYDQRNCIIISFALGFAVIPLIFTLAEDALSNVPHSLKAASLALGASRWQTVWRVVMPSASPGIFAAIIIGLGRAIGETMIVLMATGNTPIIDLSIFNGMRTLSANIAVEIPEAPENGTLYRVLFLSAVMLFLLTSVLNTTAELVRHRLRKKYGQFQ